MAAAPTLQSVWLVRSSEEKESRRRSSDDLLWKEYFRNPLSHYRNCKVCPDFMHQVTQQSLWIEWIDGRYNPPCVGEALGSKRLAALSAQLFQSTKKCTPLVAFPQSQAHFVALLRSCSKNKDLSTGTRLHDDIRKKGLLEKCSDALVTMYAQCGALAKAQALLDMHQSRNVVPWTALIAGYARKRQCQDALNCFDHMLREGVPPDGVTYTCVLKACATIGAADKGKQIHDEIARQGLLENNIVLGTALVDMHAKCGALPKAERVLAELSSRNVVTWNALITGYAQWGQSEQALDCFERMQQDGVPPDAVTYACVLKACGAVGAHDKGKQIHDEIGRQGLLQDDIVLGTALVDMYAKCGALAKAEHVLEELSFRNVIPWNALITGYAQQGQGQQALDCFERMQRQGIPPNAVTYACVLKACGAVGAVDKGEQVHDDIARQGLLRGDIILGTALVDMYAKCGALAKAECVLEELHSRDVVAWNALIAGYAQLGQGEQAIDCYERMQCESIPPDAVTYSCALKACGTIGAADKGEQIHDKIARHGLLQDNIVLGNALVDMYAKCGALGKAERVLEELPSRNVFSWNALIARYVQQGLGEQALDCFERMQQEGVPPDAATFGCVLNVCSHLGLVKEGHMLFANMSTKFGVKPDLECYTCMIDLFGRAGHLEWAVRLIREMPSSDYSAIWHALMGACQKWGDASVGRWAFDQAVQVDRSDAASYVLMANIYAAAGMQENAKNIEAMRLDNKAWKKPGCSQ